MLSSVEQPRCVIEGSRDSYQLAELGVFSHSCDRAPVDISASHQFPRHLNPPSSLCLSQTRLSQNRFHEFNGTTGRRRPKETLESEGHTVLRGRTERGGGGGGGAKSYRF